MGELVLVTGGTGYIANYIIAELLERGFRVRTTVRELESKKVPILRSGCGVDGKAGQIEIVVADLESDDGWEEACKDCAYVIHTASPVAEFRYPDGDPRTKKLIDSAIDGTMRAFRAAVASGCCKRFVFTSSVATVAAEGSLEDFGENLNEERWGNVNKAKPYARSKILAEQAAWAFSKENNLELATVLPSYVIGPFMSPHNRSPSLKTVLDTNFLWKKRVKPLYPVNTPVVDVRDLAKIHVEAMLRPEAANRRFIANAKEAFPNELYEPLRKLGYTHLPQAKVKTSVVLRIAFWSLFSPRARIIRKMYGKPYKFFDNTASRTVLGIEYMPIEQTVKDYAKCCEEFNMFRNEGLSLKEKNQLTTPA